MAFPASRMALKLSLLFHHHTLHTKILNLPSPSALSNQYHLPLRCFHAPPRLINDTTSIPSNLLFLAAPRRRRIGLVTARMVGGHEEEDGISEEVGRESEKREELAEQSMWNQMKEIVKFTGPAMGLWLCDPLMSLIDTAVVGQGSSTELAALGTQKCHLSKSLIQFLKL